MTSGRSLVVVRLNIETNPGKKEELLRTLVELISIIRREAGCRQINVSQADLHTDMIIVTEKWASIRETLGHFSSDPFLVLTGATRVLAQSMKMTISIELETASIDLKNMKSQEKIYLWAEKALSETGT